MFSGDLKSIIDACSSSGVSSAYLISVNSYPFIWLNPSLKKNITNFRGTAHFGKFHPFLFIKFGKFSPYEA